MKPPNQSWLRRLSLRHALLGMSLMLMATVDFERTGEIPGVRNAYQEAALVFREALALHVIDTA